MEGGIAPPESSVLQVLVHRFSWCSCGKNNHTVDHIKLESFERFPEPNQAIALSYGIGDFARQKHIFGHVEGKIDEKFSL